MILARYMVRQLAGPFVFGLALFSGVLLLDKAFDIVDLLLNKGVSFTVSVKVLGLFLPTALSLSVPMSILLACLLTFGRLSEDSELTAMRASGLSYPQILWPALAMAGVLCLVLIPFNGVLAPRTVAGFRSLYHDIASQEPLVKVEAGRLIQMRDIKLLARKVDRANNLMEDVWVYQVKPAHTERVYAKSGLARSDGKSFSLNLSDGQIERLSTDDPGTFQHILFRHYAVNIPFQNPNDNRRLTWRERTLKDLKKEIRARRAAGKSAGDVAAEYYMRFAISFAPLALALLGIPLGMTLERGGRGVGFGAAVGVLFGYYLLLVLGLRLAEKDALPAPAAVWIANAVTAAAGLLLSRRRMSG